MTPDDIINEELENEEEEQEEDQEPEINIIDLNNYGMKPYSWRYEGEGGGGGGGQGSGGVFIVHAVEDTLDKTWAEIKSAAENTMVLFVTSSENDTSVQYMNDVGTEDGTYFVVFINFDTGEAQPAIYATDSSDGYPVFVED